MRRLRTEVQKLRLIGFALRIIWQAAGRLALIWLVAILVQGMIPAGIVLVTKWIVDAVAEAVGMGVTQESIELVLNPALAMGALLLGQQMLSSVIQWVRLAMNEYVADDVKTLIHAKAAEVDYGFFEQPEFYNRLEQANGQAGGRTLSLLQNIGGVLQSTVTFLSIVAILTTYSFWLPVILLVSAVPAFLIVVKYNRKKHDWWVDTTQDRRQSQYFDLLMTRLFAAAEVRVNNLGSYLSSRYFTLRKRLRREKLELSRQQMVAGFAATFIGLLVTAGVMTWIVWRALQGQAQLGDLALFYQAFNQGRSLIGSLLQNVGEIYTNVLFLEHLKLFLQQDREVLDPVEPLPFPDRLSEGITFEDITFRYPTTEKDVLTDFNMHIPAGKIVAIVGENGAGKSTFMKLLCRFYDPDEGRVLIDGVDMRWFSQDELRRNLSVMFQFPMKYQFTAEQNIQFGDWGVQHDPEDVQTAAENAGAHEFIVRLPSGYDTTLGRYFEGGQELSGGQWQRIALARAFLLKAPIMILDEPTSFMDSWAEMEWIQRFKRLVKGRTALFITHRFTTAMQADLIYVLHEGQVIESGTHKQLLARGGHYASSWRTQMEQAEQHA